MRGVVEGVSKLKIVLNELVDSRIFVEPSVCRYEREDNDQTHDHDDDVLLYSLL